MSKTKNKSIKFIAAILVTTMLCISFFSITANAAVLGSCMASGCNNGAMMSCSGYKNSSSNFTCYTTANCVYYHDYYRTLRVCRNLNGLCGQIENTTSQHTDYVWHSRNNCPTSANNGVNVCSVK